MRHFLLLSAVLAIAAHAQLVTVLDINGNTVVESITTDVLGNPTTSIIETLAGVVTTAATTTNLVATTAPTSTSTTIVTLATTTTAADQEQGPVGQPTATVFTPGGPTPYTYTTVVNGVTSVILDTFLPTNPATLPPTVGASGTLWDYSSWLSIYGPTTTASVGAGANSAVGASLGSGLASILGFAVGMALVLY